MSSDDIKYSTEWKLHPSGLFIYYSSNQINSKNESPAQWNYNNCKMMRTFTAKPVGDSAVELRQGDPFYQIVEFFGIEGTHRLYFYTGSNRLLTHHAERFY